MNQHELEKRLQDLLEGELDAAAMDELQQELRENPEARELYREYVRLQNALQIRSEGVDLLSVVPMDRVVERHQRRVLINSGLTAAAMLVLGAMIMTFFLVRESPPILTFKTSPGTEFGLSCMEGKDSPDGMVIEVGMRLQVQRGTVELEFVSGVRGIVRGPADLTLQREDLLHMARGTGWFEVPKKAIGFKVSTPDLVLTDLGTEFGILSQPDFLDEVHVFTGKVEVLNLHGLKKQQLILTNEAWVVGPAGHWKKIPLKCVPFLTSLPQSEPSACTHLFKDDFETDTSSDYTSINYHSGVAIPGEFTIDSENNGVLEIRASSAAQIVHREATLGVNECYKTDWLTQVVAQKQSHIAPSTSQVLTDDPSKKRYSVRLRVDAGVFDIDFARGFSGSYKWFNNSPFTAPETFWVERISETEFCWYRGATKTEQVKIAEFTFDTDPGKLFVGLQAYNMMSRFDNLSVIDLDDSTE